MPTRIEQLNSQHAFPFTWTGPCLICDEVEIALAGSDLLINNACKECEQEFCSWSMSDLPKPLDQTDLLQNAAKALREARMPLICGLTDQSVEAQHAAVNLAKSSNAVIDWTNGNGPIAFHRALQNCGSVSCTYGEVTDRCDLAIFWPGSIKNDFSHFTTRFLRPDTATISIDWNRDQQRLAMRWLRTGLLGDDVAIERESEIDDASFLGELTKFQQQLNAAKYPVIVIDESIAHSLGNAGVLSLSRFVRAQNDVNNCRLVHLCRGNASGAAMTMNSLAAAPFGVGFRDGEAMFRGREYSGESMLSGSSTNPQADLLFLVGSPQQLPENLPSEIQTVWLCDQALQESVSFKADVTLHAGRWGLDHFGTGCRADGVPIERPQVFESDDAGLGNVVDLLTRLIEALASLR